jgi:predicted TIM-barrel fold metal-dependent hydrolase
MPIVDVHAHVFNADDLPIKGFIKAQNWPTWIALLVDKILQDAADNRRLSAMVDADAMDESDALSDEDVQALVMHTIETTPEILAALQEEIDRGLAEIGPSPAATLSGFGSLRGAFSIGERLKDANDLVKWVLLLTKSQKKISKRLVKTYEAIDLFVPMMMDMDKWVDDNAPNSQSHQIALLENVIHSLPGKIHPFVAYDPRRAIEAGVEGTLERIEDAIENRGFLGVKLYPPMGYRASNNAEAVPPLTDPGDYDNALRELFDLCSNKEIPITAHCTPAGAEAEPGVSGKNADPSFWHDTLSEFGDLRLNLAHFGGIENLIKKGRASWAWKIGTMMDEFPNLYADTGHHGVLDGKSRRKFFKKLAKLFDAHPVLESRFMFGTDWHMLARLDDHQKFLKIYRGQYEKMVDDEVAVQKFLGGNAMGFLGLVTGGKNAKRLAQYYTAKNLPKPDWLSAIETS